MKSGNRSGRMVGRVLAIAGHSFRSAVRSRLLIGMVILLLAVVVGLPATVQGDGSLAGDVRILLDYTLGLSVLVIGVALLWTSCGAIARDLEAGTLWLIMVKPVRPLELWIGRWLGLLALGAILIGLAGGGTYLLLRARLHVETFTAAERAALETDVLTGRRQVLPRPEDLAAAVAQRLERYKQRGWDPRIIPRAKVQQLAKREVLTERSAVAPGGTRTWDFALPQHLPADPLAALRIHVSDSVEAANLLTGVWQLEIVGDSATWQTAMQDYRQGVGHIHLPARLVQAGAALRVRYTNTGAGDAGTTTIFDPDTALELLIAESRFAPNLLRTLLVIGCQVGLLCAVGLAAGTFFSYPVALFFASTVVTLALSGRYFLATTPTDPLPTEAGMGPLWLQHFSLHVVQGVNAITVPAVGPSPLEKLSTGILVPWAQVAATGVILLGLYGGVLALLSAWRLQRRELARGNA